MEDAAEQRGQSTVDALVIDQGEGGEEEAYGQANDQCHCTSSTSSCEQINPINANVESIPDDSVMMNSVDYEVAQASVDADNRAAREMLRVRGIDLPVKSNRRRIPR